jgi:hypothetical protein
LLQHGGSKGDIGAVALGLAIVLGGGRRGDRRFVRGQEAADGAGDNPFAGVKRSECSDDFENGRVGLAALIELLDIAVTRSPSGTPVKIIPADHAYDFRIVEASKLKSYAGVALFYHMIDVAARSAVGGQVDVAIEIQPLARALRSRPAEERLARFRQRHVSMKNWVAGGEPSELTSVM